MNLMLPTRGQRNEYGNSPYHLEVLTLLNSEKDMQTQLQYFVINPVIEVNAIGDLRMDQLITWMF